MPRRRTHASTPFGRREQGVIISNAAKLLPRLESSRRPQEAMVGQSQGEARVAHSHTGRHSTRAHGFAQAGASRRKTGRRATRSTVGVAAAHAAWGMGCAGPRGMGCGCLFLGVLVAAEANTWGSDTAVRRRQHAGCTRQLPQSAGCGKTICGEGKPPTGCPAPVAAVRWPGLPS
ncbi:MAG: hypothetical protein J3K34DRAFT_436151 [Monoraphidium minutum]|nr:MAG: hypothetical protein J3K34DRAFT_436151 [Monoraphidium minutum]